MNRKFFHTISYLKIKRARTRTRTRMENVAVGPWGGAGGTPFNYKFEGAVTAIEVTHDDIIVSISFTSKDGDRYLHSPKFGSERGRVEDEVRINTSEETINGISGTYDLYLSSICFHTTLGNKIGPFGTERGTQFSLPIKEGVIAGFHGRSGFYVDSFGLYIKPTA